MAFLFSRIDTLLTRKASFVADMNIDYACIGHCCRRRINARQRLAIAPPPVRRSHSISVAGNKLRDDIEVIALIPVNAQNSMRRLPFISAVFSLVRGFDWFLDTIGSFIGILPPFTGRR